MIHVICIGNEFRSDDAAGLRVADILMQRNLPGIAVYKETGDGATLIERWRRKTQVILVDAIRCSYSAGTVVCIDLKQTRLNSEVFQPSSHSFGLAKAVELSRSLETLPSRLFLYGIRGNDFCEGTNLSPEVENATVEVANEISRITLKTLSSLTTSTLPRSDGTDTDHS